MQQTTGRAALVANNLPTSKSVSTTTGNAVSPVILTTSAPHGLQTNEIFSVTGVVGNLAANGVFIAGTVTGTTVALLAYPAGTSVAGTGAYVSGGTLQSLGYGITVPVPNDLTDAMRAGAINVPYEACLDRLAYLQFRTTALALVPVLSFQTLGLNSLNESIVGDTAFHDSATVLLNFIGCKVGDVLAIWLSLEYTTSDATGVVEFGFRDDVAGTNVLSAILVTNLDSTVTIKPIALFGHHVVTVAGTCRFVLRLKAFTASALAISAPGALFGMRAQLGV